MNDNIPPMPSGLTFEQWRVRNLRREGYQVRELDLLRERVLHQNIT